MKLEKEMAYDGTEIAIRSERAGQHRFYMNLLNGEVNLGKLIPYLKDKQLRRMVNDGAISETMIKESHAYTLRYLSEGISAVRKNPRKRSELMLDLQVRLAGKTLRELESDYRSLAAFLIPSFHPMEFGRERFKHVMRCAVLGISGERFRLKEEQWPTSVDEMIAAQWLPRTAKSWIGQKKVQMRNTKDGLVFYWDYAGYKGQAWDNLDPHAAFEYGNRAELRLWNVEHRRQPPPKIAPFP